MATRLRVVVGLVLVALGAAVAIPFALIARETEPPVAAGLPTALDEPPEISAVSAEAAAPGDVVTAVAVSPAPTETTSATEPPVHSTTTTTTNTAATTSTSNPPPAPPPPPFETVTFEAEAGTITGSARIWDGYPNASGGKLVRNIGNWGGTPGTLRINNVNIPSTGAYTITIYFVHPDNEANRSATITVSGNSAMTVSFNGNTECCQVKVLSGITIAAGTHTITFANPTGHAPSIDKVVVSGT